MNLLQLLPLAHALVAREDLPIPAWLFAWGASIVLIVSFFALSAGWREPRFESERWRALGAGVSRALIGLPAQILGGALGVFLLGLTVYAGLKGTEAPDRNLAVPFVFVTCWLGFPVLSVVFGNVFKLFNPWRAAGRAVGGAFETIAGQRFAHLAYPAPLGRWPAALGLVAFVWLEVVYGVSGGVAVGVSPHATAVAALAYSAYTLAMMAVFGVEEVVRRAARSSPSTSACSRGSAFLGVSEGRLGVRRPLSAAARWATVPGLRRGGDRLDRDDQLRRGPGGGLQGAIESTFKWLLDRSVEPTTALRLTDTLWISLTVLGVGLVYMIGVRGMSTVKGAPSLGS